MRDGSGEGSLRGGECGRSRRGIRLSARRGRVRGETEATGPTHLVRRLSVEGWTWVIRLKNVSACSAHCTAKAISICASCRVEFESAPGDKGSPRPPPQRDSSRQTQRTPSSFCAFSASKLLGMPPLPPATPNPPVEPEPLMRLSISLAAWAAMVAGAGGGGGGVVRGKEGVRETSARRGVGL